MSPGVTSANGEFLQHRDQIFSSVAVCPRDLHKLIQFHGDGSSIGLTGYANRSTPAHLNYPFISQDA
jgi:hypothetical protein